MEDLKTGDVVIYSKKTGGWLSSLLSKQKNYQHMGIVLKDPTYINENLKGLYVWQPHYVERSCESDSDEETNEEGNVTTTEVSLEESYPLNLEILPLVHVLDDRQPGDKWDRVYCRSLLHKHECFTDELLKDMIENTTVKDIYPKGTDTTVLGNETNTLNHGSSFVGYVYVKNMILNSETDWTKLRPQDFVDETENIRFNIDVSLDKMTHLD